MSWSRTTATKTQPEQSFPSTMRHLRPDKHDALASSNRERCDTTLTVHQRDWRGRRDLLAALEADKLVLPRLQPHLAKPRVEPRRFVEMARIATAREKVSPRIDDSTVAEADGVHSVGRWMNFPHRLEMGEETDGVRRLVELSVWLHEGQVVVEGEKPRRDFVTRLAADYPAVIAVYLLCFS